MLWNNEKKWKFTIILAAVLVGLVCASSATGATLNVPSPEYPTIQSAIDGAADQGDTIQVATGTYTENLVWENKSIALVGAGPDVTIVNGSSSGSCLVMRNVPDTARVEGFTFTGGTGISTNPAQPELTSGGGLFLEFSSPVITRNTISGNSAQFGGGLVLYSSSPLLTQNTISVNSAIRRVGGYMADGGGLLISDSSATLENNIISGNSAHDRGGGLRIILGSPLLRENAITDNSATWGGGLHGYGGSASSTWTLENNTIARNSAFYHGGGLHIGGSVTLTGNSITENSARHGGGLWLGTGAQTLNNNTITGNSAGSSTSVGHTGGGGLSMWKSAATLNNNTITANSGNPGGGLLVFTGDYPSAPTLTNNVITMNTGDGIRCHGSSPTVYANEITNNTKNGICLTVWYAATVGPSEPEVKANIISGNGQWGIECQDTAAANAATLESDNTLGTNWDGRVLQWWYGWVKVLHGDSSPASGATVSIFANDGDTIPDYGSPFITNTEGFAPPYPIGGNPLGSAIITEFEVNNDGVRNYLTPQIIEASLGDEIGTVTHSWNGRNQIVEVTLGPSNTPPTANAGADQSAFRWTAVTLDGSGSSDPDENYPLTYSWQITSMPEGSMTELWDANTVSPTFVPDMLGDYTIELVVTDSLGAQSAADSVLVSTYNAPPVADAGDDQAIIELGTIVQLDGTQSWDDEGDDITYLWEITQRPAESVAELSDPYSSEPNFVADVHGEYVIQLVVADPWDSSDPVTVTVSFTNVKPVADAGGSQAVIVGETVFLDGSASHDENHDPLTYSWSFVSVPEGSLAELTDPTLVQASFVADWPGTYIVSLMVNDGFVDSDPANVTIEVISTQDAVVQVLLDLIDAIKSLDDNSLKNRNMKTPLINKVNAVLNKIDRGFYGEALDKLENDILQKTNGCAEIGEPDGNDWITTCPEQGQVYPLIIQAIELLENLI